MSVPVRLAAFAVLLGLAFGGAALAGAAIDPTDETVGAGGGHGGEAVGDTEPAGDTRDGAEPAGDAGHGSAPGGDGGHGGDDAPGTPGAEAEDGHGAEAEDGHGAEAESGHGASGDGATAPGLAVSEGGYTLELDDTFLTAGETAPLTFRIADARGRVVRDEFEIEHTKRLHLIVVRRDTAVFEHLHPRSGDDGTWSVDLNLGEPGVYRVFADFRIGGEQRTLAADLFVPGRFEPRRLPTPATTASAPAGLDVALAASGARAGTQTALDFAVTRDGRPFEALEPYLGARGHLVALREGDLAYLHVHPTAAAAPGTIGFAATFPTPGRYRLFLQFQTGGEVRTVAYTLEVPR